MFKKFFIFLVVISFHLQAQYSNLVIGSETMEPFILTVNGLVINTTPQTQVRVNDLPPGLNKVILQIFQKNSSVNIRSNVFLEEGQESYYNLKRNNRNEYVLRLYNIVPIPKNIPIQNVLPNPMVQQPTLPPSPNTQQQGGNNIVFNPQININVGGNQNTNPAGTPPVNNFLPPNPLPGYTGPIGCPYPVSNETIQNIKNTIQSKIFESEKLAIAKQVVSTNCLLSRDVKDIMNLFTFESTKLEFAKFAYGYTYDLGNYFIVNDAFGFESSVYELDRYIQSKR